LHFGGDIIFHAPQLGLAVVDEQIGRTRVTVVGETHTAGVDYGDSRQLADKPLVNVTVDSE